MPQVGQILLGVFPNSASPLPKLPEGEKGRGRGEGKGGRTPSFPSPIRPPSLGDPLWAGVLPSYGPYGPYLSPGVSGNPPRYSDKYPIHFGTLPLSEYYHPIYQSLPLDHFETPHHVRDLIRDSEQHSVTKSHNSYYSKSSSNVKRVDPTGSRTM